MVNIYNSLTRKKELFSPINQGIINIYACGITVYGDCHIGHARSFLVFEMFRSWFEAIRYKVNFARNITDIDDKIIRKALELNCNPSDLSNKYIGLMHKDLADLNIRPANYEPRVSSYISEIISMISDIESKGYAYITKNGDLCYPIHKLKSYGELSGKMPEDLIAGSRVDVDSSKDSPLDFVLWKAEKPGEPSWDSPWGRGRPGWHIECSAMSKAIFGIKFDIHGGGEDLIFPHHENEIAQSLVANNCLMANYWIHNGLVRINNKKMSKSLNNYINIQDILKIYDEEVIRLHMFKSHYRNVLNISYEGLDADYKSIKSLYDVVSILPDSNNSYEIDWTDENAIKFRSAMSNDFSSPEAIAVLFRLSRCFKSDGNIKHAYLLKSLANIFGILKHKSYSDLAKTKSECRISTEEILRLIKDRKNAKFASNWTEADRIRDYLNTEGITLEDREGVTLWKHIAP